MNTFLTLLILFAMEFFVMRQLFIDVNRLKENCVDDFMSDPGPARMNGWTERDMDESGEKP